MPYSSDSGKAFIDRSIAKLKRFAPKLFQDDFVAPGPVSVLDIGAGSGTYLNRYKNKLIHGKFIGVEIWEPYVEQFKLREKYDELFVCDAEAYFINERSQYTNFTFLGDIVEHMEKDKAARVIDRALQATGVLFVSIPIGYYPQGEFEGNPYEVHVTDNWTIQEALDFLGPNVVTWIQDNEIGVFVMSLNHRAYVEKALEKKVAVYGICKNERNFINRFLGSAVEADQVVICDTGSTDGTWEEISNWVENHDHIVAKKIFVDPWRFDDARNTSLALVWPEIDVCISLDVDEYLSENFITETRKYFHRLPNTTRLNHRFSTFWTEDEKSFSDHWHERIHARAGYRWVLPVHEKLETHGEEQVHFNDKIRMFQKPDLNKARSSYKTLLEQSVKERPDIWKSWSFLAGEYQQCQQPELAAEAIQKALALPDSDKSYLNLQLGYIYEALQKHDKALEHFASASFYAPHVREYKVRIADYLARQGQHSRSNFYLIEASHIKDRTYGYEYDPACWGEDFDKRVHQALASENEL